jgi:hypothetical protein
MIGYQITKETLNQKAGALAFQIREWCDQVNRLQVGVTREIQANSTFLTALGNSQADADTLLNAMVAMVAIKDAITGAGTVPTARNFILTTQALTGID